MYNSLKEIKGRIAELSKKGQLVYDEAGADLDFSKVKSLEGDTTAKVAALKAINDELADLNKKMVELNALAKSREELNASMEKEPAHKNNPAETEKKVEQKSIGTMIKETGLFTNKKMEYTLRDIDMKTLFQSTGGVGWAPLVQRLPGYVASPQITPSCLQFIPQYNTDQHSIKYMLESTYTPGNVVEKAEGVALGEPVLALTETAQIVEKVGAFIPVTDEQLEDQANVEQYLTDRLTLMVRNRIEYQCLNGTGVTPLLMGALHCTNMQTQAKGADATPDAILKAIVLVQSVGFAQPSVIFMNPADWQDIALLRTSDGIYIYGNPADATPQRMWGVPLCISMNVVVGTGIVGDFANYTALYWRKGLEVAISSGYSTYFTEGKQAVKITARCSMVYFRGAAICAVTGI